eukprot:gene10240-13774_t
MVNHILELYRKLLKHAKTIKPVKKSIDTISQIKLEFRRNSSETNAEEIQKMLLRANSTLGYLKIVTPKTYSRNQSGRTSAVFETSNAGHNNPTGRAVTNWTPTNLDPDSVKRHQQTIKRAGFKNNQQAKGIF